MSTRINDINTLQKEIDQIKKRLTSKAKRQGIWENFGQKEVRYLNDKYDVCCNDHSSLILDFEFWAEDFNLSDL